jgi:poly-gamma-glutamate system protein
MTQIRRPLLLVAMALFSAAALIIVQVLPPRDPHALYAEKLQAARLMQKGTAAIHEARLGRGLAIDAEADPNQTGLIGSEYTALTTTLGALEVKRTTTNPDFAAAMVQMFWEAGVKKGESIAIGSSGSFPALALAVDCAAEAMQLNVVAICSVGASTYGATDPRLTWLDMETVLRQAGLIHARSLAASVGGNEDRLANTMFPDAAAVAEEAIRRNEVSLLADNNLHDAVDARMRIYRDQAGTKRMAAFVNIGGAEINLGTTDAGYFLPAGVLKRIPRSPQKPVGVLFSMAEAGVPVINLLNIRQLCLRYGLPVDPIPLPEPGKAAVYFLRGSALLSAIVLGVWLLVMGLLIWLDRQWSGVLADQSETIM